MAIQDNHIQYYYKVKWKGYSNSKLNIVCYFILYYCFFFFIQSPIEHNTWESE